MFLTLFQTLVTENRNSPWIEIGVLITGFAGIIHYIINYQNKSAKDRSSEIQGLLASTFCPEKVKALMLDSIEARAFELVTGSPARPKEREALLKVYRRHKGEITPRDIGRALPYLTATENGIALSKAVYYMQFISAWGMLIYFGFLAAITAILMIFISPPLLQLAGLIFLLAIFVSFSILGMKDAYELSLARKISCLTAENH
jgi:hypothetical protein